MISSLRGLLLYKSPDKLVIDVGGVGYGLSFCGLGEALLPELGHEIFIHTYLNVREDALDLFGFMTIEEKEMFVTLLHVSGIGPKVALHLLSAILPSDLARAICSEDLLRLTKLPGIGKKTAERLCLELKDKVQMMAFSSPSSARITGHLGVVHMDVISTLVNLGYPQNRAQDAVQAVRQQLPADEEPSFEEFVRLALRSLA